MGNTDTKLNFRKAVVQLTTKTQVASKADPSHVFCLFCWECSNTELGLLCRQVHRYLAVRDFYGSHPLSINPEKSTALINKLCDHIITRLKPVEAGDEAFWNQFWSEGVTCVQDVFTLIPAAEIRALREESPSNLATLCYKAVEKLITATESGCRTQREQQTVLNCVRLLTRILPYIFEDPDWRGFFWSTLPGHAEEAAENESPPLAQSLLNALSDLLFCPDFTVASSKKIGPDNPEDMTTIDSCEYIWEAGVGFAHSPVMNQTFDAHRGEILKLMLTCFSETMYLPPVADAHAQPNQWISYFTSTENRHALPLFTSMLNVVCSYDPVGYGVPYNHLMFSDSREPLVEAALQVLCVTLDNDPTSTSSSGGQEHDDAEGAGPGEHGEGTSDVGGPDNLFLNYMSRIHREEDFQFILKGLTKLLNNPLIQTYLPGSCKKIQFHQELLVLFWKMCDINKKFMFYVLKSSDVLDVLVPILYHLNDARADQSRVGLMHIGVFILLLLSGERNFGVRLNKPYTVRVPMDIPVFTGTHADFLIIVFHKIITTGHQRLQPLFDCLLTIIVNVSPYLKTLSMVASTKLLHLLEAFSTPWFLYASPTNHHLVFFLLEVFNNIIQYQFDGNSNLVYTIIRKRNVFHQMANLPTDHSSIAKALTKRGKKVVQPLNTSTETQSMEGSFPATDAEPGTLKATLAATPVLPSPILTYEELLRDINKDQSQVDSGPSDACLVDPWDMAELSSFQQQTEQRQSARSILLASLEVRNVQKQGASPYQTVRPLRRAMSHDTLQTILESQLKHDNVCDNDTEDETKSIPEQVRRTILEQADEVDKELVASELKARVAAMLGIDKMTEKSPACAVHTPDGQPLTPLEGNQGLAQSVQPKGDDDASVQPLVAQSVQPKGEDDASVQPGPGDGAESSSAEGQESPGAEADRPKLTKAKSRSTPPASPTESSHSIASERPPLRRAGSASSQGGWVATPEWVQSWKQKLPLQTIMRLLQVLVPQVEKICIDKGLTDESEILKFLQHGTLVGLLPVPHPILIRKYQANSGTTMWFRTYMWGVIYLRNVDPPVWYDTDVKLFEIQRV